MKQNINTFLKIVNIMIPKIIEKIEKLLLNFLIICRVSIKRLSSITKANNVMY